MPKRRCPSSSSRNFHKPNHYGHLRSRSRPGHREEKVEKLKGALSLETEPGKGTKFRMALPLTLARFRGSFSVSRNTISSCPPVMWNEWSGSKKRRSKPSRIGKQSPSTGMLSRWLDSPRPSNCAHERQGRPSGNAACGVLAWANQRIAFSVDEVLGEQEVLVKTLGKQLTRVRNIAGATILGTGEWCRFQCR